MTRILHKGIYSFVAFGALFGVLFLLVRPPAAPQASVVVPGGTEIAVTIADTPQLRAAGLSGTKSLPEQTGVLFIFDTPENYGFWMKDMAYPLDIIWLDADWRVVDIASSVAPETYPRVFRPSIPAQYVVEINAGEAAGDNLAIGTQVQFQK